MKTFISILMLIYSCTSHTQVYKKLLSSNVERSVLGISGGTSLLKSSKGTYLVQHSLGQFGITGISKNQNQYVKQGFIQSPLKTILVAPSYSDFENLIVFPNPFEDYINIHFSKVHQGNIRISLYNILGKLVFNQIKSPNQQLNIPIQHLPDSEYLLLLQQGKRKYKAKLIRQSQ